MGTMILLSAFIVAFSLQRSHGFSAMDTEPGPMPLSAPRNCFKGATASQPWVRANVYCYFYNPNYDLQWSYALSAMDIAAVVWDEDAEPVVTGETEQQRAGNFACKL